MGREIQQKKKRKIREDRENKSYMEKKKCEKVSKQGKYVKSNFAKINDVISKILEKIENSKRDLGSV